MNRTEIDRQAALERAHYNVLNLAPSEIELDLFSDVPSDPHPAVREGERLDAEEAARHLFGDRFFVFTGKGRSAERALMRGLSLSGTAVTNGLFRTTELAVKTAGLAVEKAKLEEGTAGVDAEWLEQRLAQGGVSLVMLEASNNQRFGWPLPLENVERVRSACDRHGAKLILDATRLLANAATDHLSLARRMLGLADAFTISCAKEYLVPHGGLIGVSDRAARRRIYEAAFEEGTLLDSKELLARGFGYMASRSEAVMSERKRKLALLAGELKKHGIRIVEPIGAHAIYVEVDGSILNGDPLRPRALEALLYLRSGMRVRIVPHGSNAILRITWALDRASDDALLRVPGALKELFDRADDAPRLRLIEGAAPIHFLDHYSVDRL